MRRFISVVFLIIVMAIAVFASCDSASDSGTASVLRLADLSLPETMDPSMSNSTTDNEFQHAVTEGLTRTTGGKLSPGIAESWDVSDDGLVYTFHLRDARWSDGVPITADDFVYSWRRLADPVTESPYAFPIWIVQNGKDINQEGADPATLGIKAVDEKTLEVRLENPTAYFLSYIGSQPSFAPIRKDIVEKFGDDFATSPDTNVYSGPFVLSSVDVDTWTFDKNPEFWNADNIRVSKTIVTYTDDEDDQVSLFESGEVDFAYLPNEYVSEYKAADHVNHYLNGNVDFCHINTTGRNKALTNRNFRRALNYAINRKLYNHNANDDVYKPYNGLVFPGLNGKDGASYGEVYYIDGYSFPIEGDVDLARKYLRDALKELEAGSPENLTVELTAIDREEDHRTAEELKSQWENILGIKVKLRYVSHADLYGKVLPDGDYDIGFGGWIPDYNDPYTYLELWKSDNTNYNQYSNEQYDALLDASITETDFNKRMDLLNKAERLLINDAAFIPLQAKDKYYMLNPRVSNLTLSYFNITIDWAYAGLTD